MNKTTEIEIKGFKISIKNGDIMFTRRANACRKSANISKFVWQKDSKRELMFKMPGRKLHKMKILQKMIILLKQVATENILK